MKGLIFTEFVEWVETRWSPETADAMIDACELVASNGGAYTSVGTYPHGEILELVTALSELVGDEIGYLVREFGRALFHGLRAAHPWVTERSNSLFELLDGVESHIHVEVRKLYPEADPPRFEVTDRGDVEMEMVYRSHRPFSGVALGLIEGAADYFNVEVQIAMADALADGGVPMTVRLVAE